MADEAKGASSRRPALEDVEKNERERVIGSPMVQKAEPCGKSRSEAFRSYFDWPLSKSCLMKGSCPAKVGKFKASIVCIEKTLMIAERRKLAETPEFKKMRRMRSGIEAAKSRLKTNADSRG